MNNYEKFEKAGLKIEKDRVLTYSKLSCPLDCRYCFVDDLNSNQQKSVAYLSDEQFDLLSVLPEEVKIIMLGCDTEFFQRKTNAINILEKLVCFKKDISVITKFSLGKEFIDRLVGINRQMIANGNILTFSISLPVFESSDIWEPKVPRPEDRIETLRFAFEDGLKTMVAIRPLLPTLEFSELEHIVNSTKDISCGYYSGPLYLKELDESLIKPEILANLDIERLQPEWMPEGNLFYKIEKSGQMEQLKSLVEGAEKPFFDGAAVGINFFKENEKHRNKS